MKRLQKKGTRQFKSKSEKIKYLTEEKAAIEKELEVFDTITNVAKK